ncbi:hypothetical protein SLE2022_307010 [Rubroshorea leprosula]
MEHMQKVLPPIYTSSSLAYTLTYSENPVRGNHSASSLQPLAPSSAAALAFGSHISISPPSTSATPPPPAGASKAHCLVPALFSKASC